MHSGTKQGLADSVTWSWETNGQFSVCSAYAAMFAGREVVPTADFTWKYRTPLQSRFFNWLAMRNRCWTSDRLARRGLPHHDTCPFCDQEEENHRSYSSGMCVRKNGVESALFSIGQAGMDAYGTRHTEEMVRGEIGRGEQA